MSHLHVTDGVLAIWLVISSNIIALSLLFFTSYKVIKKEDKFYNNLAKLGVVSALMLIAMSIPLGPVPAHLSLILVAALLLGPELGFISLFIVNLILALFGHGGITVVGLNTMIMGAELVIGYHLFSLMLSKVSWRKAIAIGVSMGLIVSVILMLITLTFAGQDLTEAFSSCSHEPQTIDEGNHFHGGLVAILGIVMVGIIIEVLIVTAIVGYIRKVRPDYLVKGGS
ncbi:energy-coupling factor ABC transporter permease [Proteinivorax tanatarense]|uniref:Energy-coupling factor ABC transporter permease n=1 Tax=Proteinivorax tanatarense TaxID=1260629 RepID=A0AAU7VI42_9FIRM